MNISVDGGRIQEGVNCGEMVDLAQLVAESFNCE